MEDITPSLLKKIQDDFKKEFDQSKVISDLYARVRDGTATYDEANDFAIEVGEILANAYKKNLSANVLPDGRMYYNIANRIIPPTMTNNYNLITEVTKQVQESLNKSAGIGIKAIVPELNKDRIRGIVNKVSESDNYDKVAWLLDEPQKNFSQSIVDDSIKANAEFQYKSGLAPKIVRTLAGNCCEWCRSLAGTYNYPEDVPNNFFRRHRYCRCRVLYYPGNGKVQNSHTKKWRNETELEKRKSVGLVSEKEKAATRFKRTFEAVPQNQVVNVMRKDSQKWINTLSEEEIRCLQKYTLNEIDENPKFYERLNAMLRGDDPQNDNLTYYANTISEALKKSTLGENIICHRGIDYNYFADYEIGEFLSLSQFTSSSVKSSGMFSKPVKIVIYAKKGTKGIAYVESLSKKPKQREVLFDKDCIYRVLSNSKELIELEAI